MAKFFPHGVKSATADARLVRRAIASVPAANIAISLEGLAVVDVDGEEGLQRISDAHLPKTLKARTGRGQHRFFKGEYPGGSFKGEKFDVLTGPGKYVVVSPSVHRSGRRYSWGQLTESMSVTPCDELDQLRGSRVRVPFQTSRSRSIAEGKRNDTLFRFASYLKNRLSSDTVEQVLQVINQRECKPPLRAAEVEQISRSSSRYVEPTEDLFGAPRITEPLPMEFLWYPYVPRYDLTMLAGDPGRGKSLLVSLLVACVTGGKPFPMSDDIPKPGRVLLLSAEDNWERVTLPRLLKHGTVIKNLHHIFKFRALTNERLNELFDEMRVWRPDLVVVDTISAYMGGGRDMHRQNEVGEFLAQLTEMAEETGAAIVALGHLNKSGGENPLYRIVGSIGFAASIRSALFFGADPDNADRLALAHGKANASEKGRTIIFEKEGGGRDDIPVLRPLAHSDVDEYAVTAVASNPVGRPTRESDEAREYILSTLTRRPISWKVLLNKAVASAIASAATMNAVRAALAKEGAIVQEGKGPSAKWRLAPERDDE